MNDLDLVRDLTPEAPLPLPGELARARGRLSAEIQATTNAERTAGAPARTAPGTWLRHGRAGTSRPRTRTRGFIMAPPRRLVVCAVAAAAVAAAIAAALAALPGDGRAPAAGPAAVSPGARPARSGPAAQQAPGTVDVAAASFLDQAAAAALRQPAQIPGPDQYVYTENDEGGGRVERDWASTAGNRPGLDMVWQGSRLVYDKVRPPCTVAQAELSSRTDGAEGGNCSIGDGYGPGYFADMPTSPGGLSAYLAEIGITPTASEAAGMGPGWTANSIGKAIEEVLPYSYLQPAQQSALYQLMAATPGFTIVRGVRDAAGRPGVGIEWDYEGGPAQMIIFSPATFAYLGAEQLGSAPGGYRSALVQIAFVNQPGQRP